METLIQTTFFIIFIFVIVNVIVSLTLYINTKKELYSRLSIFWVLLALNFIIQAVAQSSETVIILGYCYTIIPVNALLYASVLLVNKKYKLKTFSLISLLGLMTTTLLLFTNLSFFIKALPICIAVAAPLVYLSALFLVWERKTSSSLMKIEAVVLFLIAVHSINFALFRNDASTQLWGWLVSFACYQTLAALLPMISLDYYHKDEKERLEGEIAIKTADLKGVNMNLESALSEKTYLFRTLVHDVSNPLAVILGSVEVYKTNNNAEKFLDKVDRMSYRIKSLIDQVKDLEDQKLNIEESQISPVSMKESILQLHSLFEYRLRSKKLNLIYDSHELEKHWAFVEPSAFSNSVLPNVLSNAIKFSQKGSSIWIDSYIQDSMCHLVVKDEGIGVPRDILKCIFDFESKTNRRGSLGESGTGYGLPITKKILDSFGGNIYIQSSCKEEGASSSFTKVTLSFKKALPHREIDAAS